MLRIMKKAVIYSRVSSDEQKKEGFSIEAQDDLMRKYCKEKGFEIVKSFSESESAKDEGRPQFDAMVAFVRKNKSITHLIFEKNDRAIRNEFDSATLIRLATKESKHIHLVKDNMVLFKDAHPMVFFMFTLNTGISAMMPRNLSNEVLKGMQKKADSGHFPQRAPIGYNNIRINGRSIIEIDKDKAPFIKKIFELYSTGNYSYKTLAEEITKQGFTVSKTVKCTKKTIENIINNPFYMGEFDWKGKRYRNAKHKPIITHELFYIVQSQIKNKTLTDRTNKRNFLFTGVIKCAKCGCAVVGEIKKNKYIYYHCTGRHGGDCIRNYIKEETIEKEFLDVLKKINVPPEYMPFVLSTVKSEVQSEKDYNENKIKQVDKQINVLKSRLDKLFSMRLDGEISEELYREKSKNWQSELDELLANYSVSQKNSIEIYDHARKVLELCEKAYSFYLGANHEKRRTIIKTLCSNFYLDGLNLSIELKSIFKHLYDFAQNKENWAWWDSNPRPKD